MRLMSSGTDERVKFSISVEIEVPRYDSTRYLPDSIVVSFDKMENRNEGEEIQDPPKHLVNSDSRVSNKVDSKLKLFIDIFHALAGEDRYDVQEQILTQELVDTGKFTHQEAHMYIKKARNSGFISERSSGLFSIV
jgi:hypothetical protein